MSRTFGRKIGDSNEHVGRYTGDSPYQAASKAFSEYIRDRKRNKQTTSGVFKFTLIETTQNSGHKSYTYNGKRVKLSKPIVYNVKNNRIVKEYKNQIQKIKR